MNAVPKLSTIFVRANHDVLRALVGFRDESGSLVHTGVWKHSRAAGRRFLVRAESHQRVDHLLSILDSHENGDHVALPNWLKEVAFGDHPLEGQLSSEIFRSRPDAVVFSLQAEVEHDLWRHSNTGRLVYAGTARWRRQVWTDDQMRRFALDFERSPLLTPDQWSSAFLEILRRLRQHTTCAVILVTGEVPRLRPLPFDFELVSDDSRSGHLWLRNGAFHEEALLLARRHNVLIMNAAAILCGLGLDRHVPAPFRYVPDVYPILSAEFVRILDQVL